MAIRATRNSVFVFKDWEEKLDLVIFPVKNHWRDKADPGLILRSATQLAWLAEEIGYKDRWKRVVMPRPGCENGGLAWENVRPLIENRLDDRFVVVTWPEGRDG